MFAVPERNGESECKDNLLLVPFSRFVFSLPACPLESVCTQTRHCARVLYTRDSAGVELVIGTVCRCFRGVLLKYTETVLSGVHCVWAGSECLQSPLPGVQS